MMKVDVNVPIREDTFQRWREGFFAGEWGIGMDVWSGTSRRGSEIFVRVIRAVTGAI